MNTLIITLGSRGDVQPYVALGRGLKAAGHTVTVCTSSSFESFIRSYGLEYGYMSNDLLDLLDTDAGKDAIENTTGLWGTIKMMVKLMKKSKAIQRKLLSDTWESARKANPDLIVYHPKGLGGVHIAEKLSIPAILAVPAPLAVPTAEFPPIGLPTWNLGAWYNRGSYKLIELGYKSLDKVVNDFRQKELGLEQFPKSSGFLKNAKGEAIPVLHCYSKHVVHRPTDWPDTAYVNGYWFLERQEDWTPPADLQAFLDAGEPPVYVGFGSMAGKNPGKLAKIVIQALKETNLRGVIASGWGGLRVDSLPENIFTIDNAPHDWLFPRMAAVMHHGGAGTTAAGLRAGRPTIICSFIADQPFWGKRVKELGVGPAHIPHKKLSVQKLVRAFQAVSEGGEMKIRAEQLGEQIRAEDGVAETVAIIEKIAGVRVS